nr:uncharacterized protein LOC111768654 [Equus caballus]
MWGSLYPRGMEGQIRVGLLFGEQHGAVWTAPFLTNSSRGAVRPRAPWARRVLHVLWEDGLARLPSGAVAACQGVCLQPGGRSMASDTQRSTGTDLAPSGQERKVPAASPWAFLRFSSGQVASSGAILGLSGRQPQHGPSSGSPVGRQPRPGLPRALLRAASSSSCQAFLGLTHGQAASSWAFLGLSRRRPPPPPAGPSSGSLVGRRPPPGPSLGSPAGGLLLLLPGLPRALWWAGGLLLGLPWALPQAASSSSCRAFLGLTHGQVASSGPSSGSPVGGLPRAHPWAGGLIRAFLGLSRGRPPPPPAGPSSGSPMGRRPRPGLPWALPRAASSRALWTLGRRCRGCGRQWPRTAQVQPPPRHRGVHTDHRVQGQRLSVLRVRRRTRAQAAPRRLAVREARGS